MKLNASKTRNMIVSRSRTMHPQPPPLSIGITVVKKSDDLDILGVTFESKMTFEKHLPRSVSEASSQNCLYSEDVLEYFMIDCSWKMVFVLPVLEYCSAVWYTKNYWTLKSEVADF